MALELRKTTSKSTKFEGRPVLYVVSNLEDPKQAYNETFQAKDILKKNYGAYWNKFEKRWEWTVFKEGDEDIVLRRAVAAVDEANEFLQNKAEKLEPFIKAFKDIEEGLAQASTFIKKDDADRVMDNLKSFIEDLQNEVDERVFDEKIQNYLSFAASRRKFSLRNTLLLFIQNPNSKDARSKTNWEIVGRVPKSDAQSIILFRPPLRPMSPAEKEKVEAAFRKSLGVGPNDRLMPADYKTLQAKLKNGVPKSSNPESFIPYPVFDVSDTEPIKAGVGELPEEPKWFSSEPNEKADLLKDALVSAARKKGIQVSEVKPEEDQEIQGGAKGYSAGGKIVLDATVEGIGIFSVMVHETAHEILHQDFLKIQSKDNKTGKDKDFEDLYVGRDIDKIQELQAEATAYVVLKNYGLQNTASATYLVLFRNDRKNIQEHLEVITTTANKIINMIDSEIGDGSLNEQNIREELNVSQVAKMLGVNMDSDNNLDESTDNHRYEEVVFLQGEHADEALYILSKKGEEAALKYLKQWHYPGEHPGTTQVPHGSGDEVFEKDGYTMSYSIPLNYIGLIYDLQHGEMKREPHVMGDIPLNESFRALVRMELSESVLNKKSISEYSERNVEDYPWYCSSCDEELQWFEVTNDETCTRCGSDVAPNEEGANYTDMEPDDLSDMMMEKKGLWANIHAKRKRGEKPAKPGDEDYPDAKAWEKAKKSESEELSEDEWDEANSILEKAAGWEECSPSLEEAEYRGRKVQLNKPMRGDVKKFKVYVKNDKGNVVKVNFGEKGARIKKDNPERRKSFRARHNCDNPGPKWKARYWSCKKW